MKVPVGWLQDFVDLSGIPIAELVSRLSESTAEVIEVHTLYASLEQIVSAKIIAKKPHPKADKLWICTVDLGDAQEDVVCDAPNIQEDLIVPFANIGTKLANGIILQNKEIYGEYSHGMLLSEHELGISDDHSSLMVLPENTPLGEKMSTILHIEKELVLEIDNNSITHRPDLWGIYGMARECAAIFNLPFKALETLEWKQHILSLFSDETPSVSVQVNTDKCRNYEGFSVEGVDATKNSPWKIAHRLRAVGLRPINLLIDISNYVMLETGLPNHFFDRDKIGSSQLVIEECNQKQRFITLDGEERLLEPGDLLVTNGQIPLIAAGIIGGKNSGISSQTTQIFVEGAVWDPQAIRKTSLRLGLRTDASIRYEKSLDPHYTGFMLYRCAQLLKEYFPDCRFIGHIQKSKETAWQRYEVDLDVARARMLLSMDISMDQASAILQRLGFDVNPAETGEILCVYSPSWRSSRELLVHADLVEEIGRIFGYTHIHSHAPVWPLLPKNQPPHVRLKRAVQDFLVLHGQALEVMTHPLIGEKLLANAEWDTGSDDLVLTHALSPERSRLRSSLLPSFLEAIELNQKHFDNFRFFEYGRVARSLFSEDTHIGYGYVNRQHSPFFSVADILEAMLKNLRIDAALVPGQMDNPLLPSQWPGAHPYEILHIQHKQEILGYVLSIHPLLLRKRKIKGFVTLFEMKATPWLTEPRPHPYHYTPPLRYQESVLDFTVLASKGEEVQRITSCLPTQDPVHHIVSVKVLDVFHMDKAVKAVTLRIRLNSPERTLTHEDLKMTEQFIINTLSDNGWNLKN